MSISKFLDDPRASAFFLSFPSRKLNLGSGADIREGYTNVDMNDYGRPDTMVGEITDLPGLPSSNFEEIIAQDILEHIKFRDTLRALHEWNRLLVVGGRLYIRSTYLNGLARLFEKPENQPIEKQLILLTNLFSRQLVPGDFHLTAFTEPLMRFYLWAAKFRIDTVSIKDGWIFEVWAVKESDCYSLEIAHSSLDDERFVRSAYQQILCREADPAGLEGFLAQLRSGMGRSALLKTLWVSDENQARLAATCPPFDLKFNVG